MRQYELMMIIDPTLSSDERDALIAEIEGELRSSGAVIKTAEHPGERELAYRIRGSQNGYYLLYTLEKASGDFVSVTNSFNIKSAIWRFMFVKIED